MVERKLRAEFRCAVILCYLALMFMSYGCVHRKNDIGLSVEFYNKGSRSLTTVRFDIDGEAGLVPGYLGRSLTESKSMGFMPGGNRYDIPKSVEVEWVIHGDDFLDWSNNTPNHIKYSSESDEAYRKIWATNPSYIKNVDLSSILTPEIIEKVRADRLNTQLKMIVIFKDDKVEISARPYKWRKTP